MVCTLWALASSEWFAHCEPLLLRLNGLHIVSPCFLGWMVCTLWVLASSEWFAHCEALLLRLKGLHIVSHCFLLAGWFAHCEPWLLIDWMICTMLALSSYLLDDLHIVSPCSLLAGWFAHCKSFLLIGSRVASKILFLVVHIVSPCFLLARRVTNLSCSSLAGGVDLYWLEHLHIVSQLLGKKDRHKNPLNFQQDASL